MNCVYKELNMIDEFKLIFYSMQKWNLSGLFNKFTANENHIFKYSCMTAAAVIGYGGIKGCLNN